MFIAFKGQERYRVIQGFIDVLSKNNAPCWRLSDEAEAFSEFDQTVWSFTTCIEQELGIWVSLGISDNVAFVTMKLISSGARAEPKVFADLREAIVSEFATVVGSREAVEVVDSVDDDGYFDLLHEAAERRRRAYAEPDS